MHRVLIVEPDDTIRQLIETQLRILGRSVAWSGRAPPAGEAGAYDLAIVDPTAPGALEFAARAGVPLVFVSTVGPTSETEGLAPRAHLTMPYALADLERALSTGNPAPEQA